MPNRWTPKGVHSFSERSATGQQALPLLVAEQQVDDEVGAAIAHSSLQHSGRDCVQDRWSGVT